MLCDSHIHVVGDPDAYPLVAARSYTPETARIEAVQRVGAPHGITRFVIVQPSFYGTDNTLLVETLAKLGPLGRGVAVVDPAACPELDGLAAAGVRGLRMNLYSGGTGPNLAARFGATVQLAATMQWHVQVIAPLPILVGMADMLAAAAVPIVIDHYGLPGGFGPDSAEGRCLLALGRHRHVWVKLSAPYRSTGDALGTTPDPAWLAALLDVAADRCVWGSDWPHTPAHETLPGGGVSVPYRALEYARVVAGFRDAMTSAVADRIMGDNPARLYGFVD